MKKRKKWIWIPITAVVLAASITTLAVLKPGQSKDPIYVYRIGNGEVGMSDYYEGGSESYGNVTTDRIQPVYLSDTQTVTDVKVTEGQKVKKGDVLFTYDTTLSELQLQRKDLAIQQLKVNLSAAKKELKEIKSYKPISYRPTKPTTKPAPTKPSDGTIPNLGDVSGVDYRVYSGSGASKNSPKFCWLRSGTMVDETVMADMFGENETRNTIYVVFQNTRNNAATGKITNEYGLVITRTPQQLPTDPTDPPTEPPTDPSEPVTEPPTEPSTEPPTDPSTEPPTDPSTEPPTDPSTDPTEDPSETDVPTDPITESETETPTEAPSDPTEPPTETGAEPAAISLHFLSAPTPRTGEPDYTYQIGFFNPPSADEIAKPAPPADDSVDWNSGFTASEIASMRKEKEAEISQLNFDIKMAQAEYKIMQKEADDGEVKAEFDGVVQNILDPSEARTNKQPMLRVSGGGGFYVEATISELDLATLEIGQEVSVTSYDTWETVTGTVSEIGKYPADQEYGYWGPANVSYYPYKVFIDESANLQDGSYVSMTLASNQTEESKLYLSSAFVLTDTEGSYVYIRGAEGLLEKRRIQTGKSLWNTYVQIVSGLTADDWVAFPYGREVREGVPTADGSYDTLYG